MACFSTLMHCMGSVVVGSILRHTAKLQGAVGCGILWYIVLHWAVGGPKVHLKPLQWEIHYA